MNVSQIRNAQVSSMSAIIFTVLLIIFGIYWSFLNYDSVIYANIALNISLFVFSSIIFVNFLRKDKFYILTPIPWFYAACAAYYGFGPLSWYFSNDATAAYINFSSGNPIGDVEIFESNILCLCGITIVSISLYVLNLFFRWEREEISNFIYNFDEKRTRMFFYFAFFVGFFTKYIIVLILFNNILFIQAPNFVSQLGSFFKVAILVGYILNSRKRDENITYLVAFAIIIEIVSSFISTSKTEILFTVMVILVGRFISNRSMIATFSLALATAIFYVTFLAGYIVFVRVHYDGVNLANVSTFVRTVEDFLERENAVVEQGDAQQLWWARINFTNYQSFAIRSYDSGRSGTTLQDAGWAFMPRALFPNKPDLNSGKIFSDELLTGSGEYTQTAMTYFAEGYWNFGVLGLILVSIWASIAFVITTIFSFGRSAKGSIAGIFVSVYAIQLGFFVDGWFVSGMIGGFGLLMLYGFGIVLMEAWTRGQQGR